MTQPKAKKEEVMGKHTPIPWRESENKDNGLIVGPNGENIGVVYNTKDRPFIVRAVNSHESLLEGLKFMLKYAPESMRIKNPVGYVLAKEALKQAEEE